MKKIREKANEKYQEVKSKPWTENAATVMGVTGTLINSLGSVIPGIGYLGGALKIGSAILNPDVKLEDLKRTEVVISKGNKSVLENVGNLEGVVKMLQTEVKDSFKEIAIEMKQISLEVQEINNHVNEIFAVVTELHYKDGPEKIEAMYEIFLDGSNNVEKSLERFKTHSTEFQINYKQNLKPEKVLEYLKIIKDGYGENACRDYYAYILGIHGKYLQMISLFYIFDGTPDQISTLFERFNKDWSHLSNSYNKLVCNELHFVRSTMLENNKDVAIVHGLEKYFPNKLGIQELFHEVEGDSNSVTAIPLQMLSKILKMNMEGRNCLENLLGKTEVSLEEREETVSRRAPRRRTKKEANKILSPQDVFMVAYEACDLMLQQQLLQKMFMVKLAFPFLLPSQEKNILKLTSWPFKSTILEWKNFEENSMSYKAKTVSFIRIGRPHQSKSVLINEMMSENKQETFFNRNCPQGEKSFNRVLSDGSVEMFWYLPQEDTTNSLSKKATRILNLRGDSLNHAAQVKFLSEISSTIFVQIEAKEVKENHPVVTLLSSVKCNVILFWTQKDKDSEDEGEVVEKACEVFEFDEPNNRNDVFEVDYENEFNLRKTIKSTILRTLEKNINCFSHQQIVSLARKFETPMDCLHITVDEDHIDCKKGTNAAKKVLHYFENANITECKREYLPLQSSELWGKWSELEKRRRREKIFTNPEEASKSLGEMNEVRKRQSNLGVTPFMEQVITQLWNLKSTPKATNIFIQTIKLFLDEWSKQGLPELRRKREKQWSELRKTREKNEKNENLEFEYEQTLKNISESSFGVEHIFREISQIHEIRMEGLLNATFLETIKLPDLMAGLIRSGMTFELLDGEASNIPRIWIKSVFQALQELVGEKRCSMVSVIGLQSSGKSTLLNSIYGLDFSVSSGRCTQGVFLKLLPVNKEERVKYKIQNDFILVIDTEGLRSPELLDDKKRDTRDNEFAALSVGLGNVSLINMFGENISDLKDILQIVVLSFLRMKISLGNLFTENVQNCCMFLHQNVNSINADEKMKAGLQNLVNCLDEATKEAAETENIQQIRTFNQVLKFDTNQHVMYFPGLWKGDPPMAPVNPTYCKKAEEAKLIMLKALQSGLPSLQLNEIFYKIDELWNGVLTENFIFNFKNGMYIKAYDALEKEFRKLSNTFQDSMSKVRRDNETKLIKKEDTDVREPCMVLVTDLREEGNDFKLKRTQELENFFVGNQFSDILEEWRIQKLNQFDQNASAIIRNEEQKLKRYGEELYLRRKINDKLDQYRKIVICQAKEFAERFSDNESEEDLVQEFDAKWSEWITALEIPDSDDTGKTRRKEAYGILIENFNKHFGLVKKESYSTQFLNPDVSTDQTKLEKLVTELKLEDFDNFVNIGKHSKRENLVLPKARDIVKKCIRECGAWIKEFMNSTHDYDFDTSSHLKTLIEKSKLEKHQPDEIKTMYNITFLMPFQIKLTVKIVDFALPIFEEIQKHYEKKNGIRSRVESEKENIWQIFKATTKREKSEMILARSFVKIIAHDAKEKIESILTDEIYSFAQETYSSKTQLLIESLDELIDLGWDDFQKYLNDPKLYCLKRSAGKIENDYFGLTNTKYFKRAQIHWEAIRAGIENARYAAATQQKQSKGVIKDWLEIFVELENIIGFQPSYFSYLEELIGTESIDTDRVQEHIVQYLDAADFEMSNYFIQITAENVKFKGTEMQTPYEKAFDGIWGCEERCPFCKEFCRHEKNHLSLKQSHSCIQHRPQGFGGTRNKLTKQLVIKNCNFDVQSYATFPCGYCKMYRTCKQDNCSIFHKYSNYKKYFPDWDIPRSDVFDSSAYWIFMMNKYGLNLAQYWNTTTPDMPRQWRTITKNQAKESLRKFRS